jgi:hypothetical protein
MPGSRDFSAYTLFQAVERVNTRKKPAHPERRLCGTAGLD